MERTLNMEQSKNSSGRGGNVLRSSNKFSSRSSKPSLSPVIDIHYSCYRPGSMIHPVLDKNETTRFLGDGVSFKAKLIGILEVSEARGDRMCQEALSDLKMAIRAAGEHKQRITINIAIDGLRLRDEKTGDSLYHHPVHKISFIAQDMTDSRAFGYIFGSPDTGHRFFGIKTDKAASQVVIAMRDLFQVVFALKKKEIELAKQHLDKSRFTSSPLFSDTALPKLPPLHQDMTKSANSDSKAGGGASSESKSGSGGGATAVADLVDLELELNSLQQGLTQMERITPSDPFGSKDDPFGDSFTSYTKPILPPPPSSGRERMSRTSESGSLFSPRTPHTTISAGGSLDTTSSLETSLLGSSSKDTLKTTKKEFTFSQDFNSSREEPSSGDWFTPSAGNSIFEEQPSSLVPSEPSKDEKHELAKQEILSQFDVFTELDPLGTGRSKPYIDKKHFFQELKNPPKKVLNDLVCQNQPPGTGPTSTANNPAKTDQNLFNATFNNNNNKNKMAQVIVPAATAVNSSAISATTSSTAATNDFTADPFGEDPFVTEDPFAETDFSKQDPFEAEFGDFKVTHSSNKVTTAAVLNNLDKKFKIDTSKSDSLQTSSIYQNNLSRSPVNSAAAITMMSTSPKTTTVTPSSKQTSFVEAVHFDSTSKFNKLAQLHENASLDMSSESSECAPEPPPRPASTLVQIKPPPLPPKKQANDLTIRPPPRPPHSMTEDPHYDYMDNYETAPNSLEFVRQSAGSVEKSPPLPVPVRKAKFDHQDMSVPERPRKQQFSNPGAQSSEEDYLTPISFPEQKSETSAKRAANLTGSGGSATSGILLPPPQKSGKKSTATGPTPAGAASTASLDGLDITLSQLTLSGLNELAAKLNIPANQLSNMTLVQLTGYLSNVIKSKSEGTSPSNVLSKSSAATVATQDATTGELPMFKADFAANFSSFNNTVTTSSGGTTDTSYDRYAVFRELMKEEIKQTKIDTEPEELQEEKQQKLNNTLDSSTSTGKRESESEVTEDKYAALREIVESELKSNGSEQQPDNTIESIVDDNEATDLVPPDQNNLINEESVEDTTIKIINIENRLLSEDKTPDKKLLPKYSSLIEQYSTSLLNSKDPKVILPAAKSPPKSPRSPVGRSVPIKSPVPAAITEIIVQNTGGGGRLNSGSLSDVISGSSPEIDNTASNSEAGKKTGDATGETWAIFDQGGVGGHRVPSVESTKEKQAVQSEEGVSPWSSDSKEFGNGSPTDWRRSGGGGRGGDSGSGGDHRWPTSNTKRRGRKQQQDHHQEGWWDTSAEPEMQYYPSSNQHRRSTDSYEEEYYECYEQQQQQQRPTRRRKQTGYSHGQSIGGQTSAATAAASAGGVGGGHSSSSRDVSPWEEEPPLPQQRSNVGRREQLPPPSAAMREREREPTRTGGGGSGGWSTGGGQRHHGRHHSFEKSRDRDGGCGTGRRHKTAAPSDSWDDDDDDYEYEDEHIPRYHRPSDRYRDGSERESRHSGGSRDHDSDRWTDDWTDDNRRHRRRRDGGADRDRWCCPDWEQEKLSRYGGSGRYSEPIPTTGGGGGGGGSSWRDRKQHDDRYYSRESQESPWEDDYSNDADDIPPHPPVMPPLPTATSHYLTASSAMAANKRNWKQRPSSASEMDRKTGEIKSSRHYLGTGGSDGERDRRYKPGRRSRSRDSQYSEPPMAVTSSSAAAHRHKPPASESAVGITPSGGSARSSLTHRTSATSGKLSHGMHLPSNKAHQQFEMEFEELTAAARTSTTEIAIVKTSLSLSEHGGDVGGGGGGGNSGSLKSKSATLAARKKAKDSPKSEDNVMVSTFPRNKGAGAASRAAVSNKSLFENDFVVTATTTASEESPVIGRVGGAKFNFENDFETSETDSLTASSKSGGLKTTLRQHQSMFEKGQSSLDSDFASKDQQSSTTYTRQRSLRESRLSSSPRFQQNKPKSLFEDDFSPSGEKPDPLPEDNSISSIKEEIDPNEEDEEDDSFNPTSNNFEQLQQHQQLQATNGSRNKNKKKFNKHRLSSNHFHSADGGHIKKSESVNIFACENDPFDDDFFSETGALDGCRMLQDDEDDEDDEDDQGGNARRRNNKTRTTDLKWTDDFEEYSGSSSSNRRK